MCGPANFYYARASAPGERMHTKNLLTVQELQDELHICRQSAYKLIQDGLVKGFKNHGKYLLFADSIAEYINSCYNQQYKSVTER